MRAIVDSFRRELFLKHGGPQARKIACLSVCLALAGACSPVGALETKGALQAASADGAVITPGSGTLTDGSGNAYAIDANGDAMENGSPIPGGGGTSAMEYSNGTVYGQDAGTGDWYTWSGTDWNSSSPPPAGSSSNGSGNNASSSNGSGTTNPPGSGGSGNTGSRGAAGGGTVITPGSGTFTDSAGNTYAIDVNGNAMENGSPIPGGGGTSAMEYSNGAVYGQDAGTGDWYTWNGSVWTPSSPPSSTDGNGGASGGSSGGNSNSNGSGSGGSGGSTGSAPGATFFDNFATLSLHEFVQPGDTWALISPGTPDGRGGPNDDEQGDQWWTNPFNPQTPIQGLYTGDGQLELGLLPTPAADQSYIDNAAGTHLPYVGTLLNSTPSLYQLFGYFEVTVAVDNLPGFSFQACLESWELSGSWPPEIDIRIQSDGSGSQTVLLEVCTIDGTNPTLIPMDATGMHAYGIDWEADNITFYIDRRQVLQVPTPQDGTYTNYPTYWYLLTGANYINLGVDPDPSALPVHANVASVAVWASRPF